MTIRPNKMVDGEIVPLSDPEWAEYQAALTPSLDQLKAAKASAVDALRDGLLASGFSCDFGAAGVHVLQTRGSDDRVNWLTSQAAYTAMVAAGQGDSPGAVFRSADNQTFTVTFSEGLQALLSMASWGAAVYRRSWELKDAVAAAADASALDVIDIAAGWPA
ncbi:hypothetical protein ABEG18_12945 [Alsobacter sp. KACC 23698]|uniref:DUF4376 domain-containing protein n=1 Tax=Alsobacter sp. KACC 23698 TaxID=3149229 RepID=A0AAU7JMY3_9HYPH